MQSCFACLIFMLSGMPRWHYDCDCHQEADTAFSRFYANSLEDEGRPTDAP